MTKAVTVPGTLGDTVRVGGDEPVGGPAWGTHEAVVSGSPAGMVRDGPFVTVTAGEGVTGEVTVSGISGGVTVAGISELDSSLGLVAVGGMVSDSLWEKSEDVLGAAG